MTRNFILQYFFIGVYVVAAFNDRFYELPKNKELFTSWVEEKPIEKKLPLPSANTDGKNYNRDILDFIRTLDSLVERTASEIRSSLKNDNNINIGLIDSTYDNDEIYNDINVNKIRDRRQLENDRIPDLFSTNKPDVQPKKTHESEFINMGFLPPGLPSNLFFPSTQNSTENKKPNENKSFLSFFERFDNGNFDDIPNVFNTSKNNFSYNEPSRKIRNITPNLSPDVGPIKALNITKEREIKDGLGVVDAPSFLNHEEAQASTIQEGIHQKVDNTKLNKTLPSNEANKNEVRILTNISPTNFDLLDEVMLQNRLKSINNNNHLQEFGMKRVLEEEDESKKINTILQQMMNKNDEPVVESVPGYKIHDGSEKRKIYSAVTFAIIGGIIFVGFVAMLAFSLLKVRRENVAGRVFVPPMTTVHE